MTETSLWMIVPGNPGLSALILFVIAMPFLYAARKPVHELLHAVGRAWETEATPFGPRQRWLAAVTSLPAAWPVVRNPPYGGRRRWRLGEVTLPWSALAPPGRT